MPPPTKKTLTERLIFTQVTKIFYHCPKCREDVMYEAIGSAPTFTKCLKCNKPLKFKDVIIKNF